MGVTYNSTLDYYSSRVITSGLIVHLDAANPRSYPGTGNIWYDLTGNNRNGIKLGTSSTTYPCFNSRGYFNFIGGVVANNYSRFEVSAIPSMTEMTAILWFKSTQGGAAFRMQNSDFEITIGTPTRLAAGTNYNDIATYINAPSALNGNWHQFSFTYNGYSISGYLDGNYGSSAVRSGNSVSSTASGILNIGTRSDSYFEHYFGDIAQLLIYNRCLTATEIKYMYDLYYRRFLY
jgi:hypothetical protein